MAETRKIAAILAADVVGFSRMASADEDRTLARLRTLRSELIDPTIASQNGRVFKRTGDGALVEFRSVVEAVRCAIIIQNAMIERNVGLPADQRIEFRIGVHLGDVVEESDGDLMGDGVNIAARLEGIAEPGAICLSEDAYRQVSGRLDMEVTDLGSTQLKNIARPIRAYSLQVGVPAQTKPATQSRPPEPKKRSMLVPLVAGIVALIVLVGGTWYFLSGNRSASDVATNAPAAHLSIVVLPFANLSGDPAQDYFADGITDNLTTEMSRIRPSFVIAHSTAMTYKGKAVDAKEIGKELGVRYVLEGSVQREGSQVRVNAQLIDAETGAHRWADRFEEDVADLFKLQDLVVARLANSFHFELIAAEAARDVGVTNPDAIDFVMRGKALWFQAIKRPSKEAFEAVIDILGRALAIDPNEAEALAYQAQAYVIGLAIPVFPWDKDLADKALGEADKAIALKPDTLMAYHVKSMYLTFFERRADKALRIANEGLAINPNYTPLYMSRQFAEMGLGQFGQARSDIKELMRLSPRDPGAGVSYQQLGFAEFGLGHFEASAEEFNKAIDAGWRPFTIYVGLAAAYAAQNKTFDAKAALDEARKADPNVTIKHMAGRFFDMPGFSEALKKAGVPEE
jgi:adenylate cyclase